VLSNTVRQAKTANSEQKKTLVLVLKR